MEKIKVRVWTLKSAVSIMDNDEEKKIYTDFISYLLKKTFGEGTKIDDVVDININIDYGPNDYQFVNETPSEYLDEMISYNGDSQQTKEESFRLYSGDRHFVLGYYSLVELTLIDQRKIKVIEQSFGDGDVSYIIPKKELIASGYEITQEEADCFVEGE